MMLNFEKNTKEALMRLYAVALMVECRLTECQLRWLQRRVEAQGLEMMDVLRLVRDYEKCAFQLAERGGDYFFGNERLPQYLVEACFEEVEGDAMRLYMATELYQLLHCAGEPSLQERFFLESAVGYWGINNLWHAWLLSRASGVEQSEEVSAAA